MMRAAHDIGRRQGRFHEERRRVWKRSSVIQWLLDQERTAQVAYDTGRRSDERHRLDFTKEDERDR